MLRRLAIMIVTFQMALFVASPSVSAVDSMDSGGARTVPAGRWVTVRPPLGLVSEPIRVYVTDRELTTVASVERMIEDIELVPVPPLSAGGVTWRIEKGVGTSPTFRLQRSVLYALNRGIDGVSGIAADWPVTIVVARTQKFIRETLARLNCRPNLDRFDGLILMGAAVCNRRIIVSNITGYLYLVRADQSLTRRLERKREKPISSIPYRLVMRSSSALAHEFVHIWRAAGLSGRVASDEPAWFSEGFAEFWAGVGKVLAYPARINYLTHHVVRIRDFSDWANSCTEPLETYRRLSSYANGCEYHLGVIAVEYLYAKYSNVEKTLAAFETSGSYTSFRDGFRALFGITLEQFEAEADRYIEDLRRAERLG